LSNNEKHALEDFWKIGSFSFFKGKNDLSIKYAHFDNGSDSPAIVISPGRCESYLKYKENIFDLYQSGYSVFILDHRGQGLSERLLTNNYKGYVHSFDDYADDLYHFINTIVIPYSGGNLPYLLAHSMGCTISLRMFQLYPKVVDKAVLLSPMIAINTGGLPNILAFYIIALIEQINRLLSKTPWYFIGQSDYKAEPFKNNRQTHSESRYERFVNIYKKHSKIQLGGATVHWLYEAFNTERKVFSNLNKISTPICMLQAANDSIVDNKKQKQFCQALHNISSKLITEKPIIIQGAFHELLFEKDNMRSETLTRSLQFFSDSTSD